MHKFWAIAVGCALSVGMGVAQQLVGRDELYGYTDILVDQLASFTGPTQEESVVPPAKLPRESYVDVGGASSSETLSGADKELLVEFDVYLPSIEEVIVDDPKLFETETLDKEWRQLDTVLDKIFEEDTSDNIFAVGIKRKQDEVLNDY